MDTFLTVLGWFIGLFGMFLLFVAIKMTRQTEKLGGTISDSKLRGEMMRSSCLGNIVAYIVSVGMVALGAWLAWFR